MDGDDRGHSWASANTITVKDWLDGDYTIVLQWSDGARVSECCTLEELQATLRCIGRPHWPWSRDTCTVTTESR